MSGDDLRDFRDEALNPQRHANLDASEAAVRVWEQAHPWVLDDFLDFLTSFQELFGAFAARQDVWTGRDFRL